ncbi:MAG: hypothetical protein JJU20_03120 [Opitutales bacterium]|nr:hypothetical protein [Opitutales bacterium]
MPEIKPLIQRKGIAFSHSWGHGRRMIFWAFFWIAAACLVSWLGWRQLRESRRGKCCGRGCGCLVRPPERSRR